jgi:uncharacterized protein YutE (UPF0331/DUF86 family)
MSPTKIRVSVVTERVSWIRKMLNSIQELPTDTYEYFIADSRNVAAAESYLRRGLEALLDLGRHILAKGFGQSVTEYKQIGDKLVELAVLTEEQGKLLRKIAGYRNRMVHFYQEVTQKELYRLCTQNIQDVEIILEELLSWMRNHPQKMDQQL